MNKLFAFLAIALLSIAGSYIVLQEQDKNTLATQLAESVSRAKILEADAKKARAERDKLRADNQQLELQLGDTTKALTEAKAVVEKAATNISASASSATSPRSAGMNPFGSSTALKGVAEMMKNPAMREMAKQQQIAMMDAQYAGLFSHLQLDDAEKNNLKQLLAERLSAQTDLGLKLMESSITPEQRKKLMEQATAATTANDEKIRTFMNDDADYATFKNWEATKGERQLLAMGQADFANEPLTPAQESQLIDTMHRANIAPSNAPNPQSPQNFDPTKSTPADLDRYMARYDAIAIITYNEAAKFLSPGQLAAFKKTQEKTRAMQEAGLKMSSLMFGNGGRK